MVKKTILAHFEAGLKVVGTIPLEPEIFEAYAENNTPAAYRIFWYYGPNKKEITILAITPHP